MEYFHINFELKSESSFVRINSLIKSGFGELMGKRIDYDQLTQAFIKTLRGSQTQEALSLDLQANFNIVNRWETGQRGFYWQDFLSVVELKKFDLAKALNEVTHFEFSSSPNAEEVLKKLIQPSAREVLKDSFSIQKMNRLIAGKSKLLFSDFLWMIDALYGRTERFLYKFLQGLNAEEVESFFKGNSALHTLLADDPFISLLHMSLSLDAYLSLSEHSSAVLADVLRTSPAEVQSGLDLLEELGAIEKKDGIYVATKDYVDTGAQGKVSSRKVSNYWRNQIREATRDPEKATPGYLSAHILYPSNPILEEKIFEICRKFYIDIKNLIAANPDQKNDRIQYLNVDIFKVLPRE